MADKTENPSAYVSWVIKNITRKDSNTQEEWGCDDDDKSWWHDGYCDGECTWWQDNNGEWYSWPQADESWWEPEALEGEPPQEDEKHHAEVSIDERAAEPWSAENADGQVTEPGYAEETWWPEHAEDQKVTGVPDGGEECALYEYEGGHGGDWPHEDDNEDWPDDEDYDEDW